MTRSATRWILPAVMCASCVPGTTYLGFSTGVSNAPPPPPVVWADEPAVALATGHVYVVSDPSVPYDVFRFGATWYLYSGGYWYRAPTYRGPFTVVDVRRVPREVIEVPPGHWKHHPRGPPGHERRRGRGHGD